MHVLMECCTRLSGNDGPEAFKAYYLELNEHTNTLEQAYEHFIYCIGYELAEIEVIGPQSDRNGLQMVPYLVKSLLHGLLSSWDGARRLPPWDTLLEHGEPGMRSIRFYGGNIHSRSRQQGPDQGQEHVGSRLKAARNVQAGTAQGRPDLNLRLASTQEAWEWGTRVVVTGADEVSLTIDTAYASARMKHRDVSSLQQLEMFTDEVVNGYCGLLGPEAALIGGVMVNTLVTSNGFGDSSLVRNNQDKRFNIISKLVTEAGNPKLRYLFIPYNFCRTALRLPHWVLLVLDVQEMVWTGCDSAEYDCREVAKSLQMDLLPQLLGRECEVSDLHKFRFTTRKIPKQPGATECGVYTCLSALSIIRRQEFPASATTDAVQFALKARCYIAESVFLNSITPLTDNTENSSGPDGSLADNHHNNDNISNNEITHDNSKKVQASPTADNDSDDPGAYFSTGSESESQSDSEMGPSQEEDGLRPRGDSSPAKEKKSGDKAGGWRNATFSKPALAMLARDAPREMAQQLIGGVPYYILRRRPGYRVLVLVSLAARLLKKHQETCEAEGKAGLDIFRSEYNLNKFTISQNGAVRKGIKKEWSQKVEDRREQWEVYKSLQEPAETESKVATPVSDRQQHVALDMLASHPPDQQTLVTPHSFPHGTTPQSLPGRHTAGMGGAATTPQVQTPAGPSSEHNHTSLPSRFGPAAPIHHLLPSNHLSPPRPQHTASHLDLEDHDDTTLGLLPLGVRDCVQNSPLLKGKGPPEPKGKEPPEPKGKEPPEPKGTGPKPESKKRRRSKKETGAAKENVQPDNAAGTSAATKPSRKSGSGRALETPHKFKEELI